jgi:L-fuconolactonase
MAPEPEAIIDSHLHIWDRSRFPYHWILPGSALDRDVLPETLRLCLYPHQIAGGVLVEASNTPAETPWLLEVAQAFGPDWGVIGWVDTATPHAPNDIRALAHHQAFRGIRLNLMHTTRPAAAALHALADHNCVLEVLIDWRTPEALWSIIEQHPQLVIVIDHFGGPTPTDDTLLLWQQTMSRLAACDNVVLKISSFGPDTPLAVLIDLAACLFGTQRLVFGSNWPIISDYHGMLKQLHQVLVQHSQAVRAALLAQNAARIYRLGG